jgi:hypothetical protein
MGLAVTAKKSSSAHEGRRACIHQATEKSAEVLLVQDHGRGVGRDTGFVGLSHGINTDRVTDVQPFTGIGGHPGRALKSCWVYMILHPITDFASNHIQNRDRHRGNHQCDVLNPPSDWAEGLKHRERDTLAGRHSLSASCCRLILER